MPELLTDMLDEIHPQARRSREVDLESIASILHQGLERRRCSELRCCAAEGCQDGHAWCHAHPRSRSYQFPINPFSPPCTHIAQPLRIPRVVTCAFRLASQGGCSWISRIVLYRTGLSSAVAEAIE